ncbi:hypothetical protein E7744_01495 [Citricoccus sp. SGAir0253]|uniref:hypothetical protein n=1 Tax=Citricoccus sp. SGAir0253 TaxID=2567881 RepID=UPI0010CCC7A2|nr:hypothetical protein [Citricoccus sp. SGAir0253]QCU77043.1 hypothetical protein E7744_01495 [Citricoccus sp. SGAir0253]
MRATSAAVGLVAASVPLHAAMLAGHGHGPVLTTVMAAMVLWCLWCAAGTARAILRPAAGVTPACHGRSLRHLWAMALAMVMLHVVLLTGFPFFPGGHRHGGASAAVSGTAAGPDAGGGLMLAVVGLELAVCFACAVALRAGRRGT